MKALTLWQPWASLVMAGEKVLETRSWAWHTAPEGERLAIHAAARAPTCWWDSGLSEHFARVLANMDLQEPYDPELLQKPRESELLPRGALLGTVELVASEPTPNNQMLLTDKGPRMAQPFMADAAFVLDLIRLHHPGLGPQHLSQEMAFGDFGPERWAWVLDKPLLLPKPIPCRGHQRLWKVPDKIAASLARAAPAGRRPEGSSSARPSVPLG